MPGKGRIVTEEEKAYDLAVSEYNDKVREISTELITIGFHPEVARKKAEDRLELKAHRKMAND